MQTSRPRARHLALAFALVFATSLGAVLTGNAHPAAAATAPMTVTSASIWKQNASPQAWTQDNRITYNSLGANGMWGAYSADPDGGNVKTWSAGPTNRGASDVTPDGKYAILTQERSSHIGAAIGAASTDPGKGAWNDLVLTDGTHNWQLTGPGTPVSSGNAIIWPRFNHDGTKLVWSQQYHLFTLNEIFGYWQMKTADIVWTNGVPSLANITTLKPQTGRFYETYGFSADNKRIIFASDMFHAGWYDTQIWSMNVDGTDWQQISPTGVPVLWTLSYCEFATAPLADGSIVFGRGWGSTYGGMDYWVRTASGSVYQLTTPSATQTNHIAGGFAISPDQTHMIARLREGRHRRRPVRDDGRPQRMTRAANSRRSRTKS